MANDFADESVSSKSTTGLVEQIGAHTATSATTLQSVTAARVGEAEFFAVVEGGQVARSFRSIINKFVYIYSDLGIAN